MELYVLECAVFSWLVSLSRSVCIPREAGWCLHVYSLPVCPPHLKSIPTLLVAVTTASHVVDPLTYVPQGGGGNTRWQILWSCFGVSPDLFLLTCFCSCGCFAPPPFLTYVNMCYAYARRWQILFLELYWGCSPPCFTMQVFYIATGWVWHMCWCWIDSFYHGSRYRCVCAHVKYWPLGEGWGCLQGLCWEPDTSTVSPDTAYMSEDDHNIYMRP